MGPFVCKTCLTPSDHATACPRCGSRTFELAPGAEIAARQAFGRPEPRGQIVSISEAPSFRRRRRGRLAMR